MDSWEEQTLDLLKKHFVGIISGTRFYLLFGGRSENDWRKGGLTGTGALFVDLEEKWLEKIFLQASLMQQKSQNQQKEALCTHSSRHECTK